MIFGKSRASELIQTTHAVNLDDANAVEASITQATGDLVVGGGAIELMYGEFAYPEPLAPIIDYRVFAGRGRLAIDHQHPRHVRTDRDMHWNIALNDVVPLDLRVNRATGPTTLDVSTLNLTALALDHATGDTTIDLSGSHPSLTTVKLSSATGELRASLTGRYEQLTRLKAKTATGDITLDLSGTWETDLHARVEVATGDIELRVPDSCGVEVKVAAAISRTLAPAFRHHGKTFRNAAFGVVPVTLSIAIEAAVANITLESVS